MRELAETEPFSCLVFGGCFSTLLYGNTVDPEPVHISLYLLADNTEHSSVYLVNIAD